MQSPPPNVHWGALTRTDSTYGDGLPESFECKEGELIQNVTVEAMRALIGGIK